MEIIIKDCLANAVQLLRELNGEFYPFAFVAKKGRNISNLVHVYFDDEFPSSETVVHELTKALNRRNIKEEYDCVCICIDILYAPSMYTEKVNAIQIKANHKYEGAITYIFPYQIKNNKILINDPVKTNGETYMDWGIIPNETSL